MPAILIQVDYSFDTGFFANPEARAVMERVASEIGNSISANLVAIDPSGENTWEATIFDPRTGAVVGVPNLIVGPNSIRLFVGGRPIAGGVAGFGGFGGYSITGTQSWINTVETRGWGGFAPWGGSVAFDTSENWFFGQTTAGLASPQLDPPGAIALFADVNADGNGDVLLFFPNGTFVLDGATGQLLGVFADVSGDGISDALLFSPPGTPQTLFVGGTGRVFVLS